MGALLSACGGGGGEDGAVSASEADAARSQAMAAATVVWTPLTTEGKIFYVANERYVRYGTGTRWVKIKASGRLVCDAATFGSDPAPGLSKACEIRGTYPGIAVLTWDASTDPALKNYRVYFGSASGDYQQEYGAGIAAGEQTTFAIGALATGSSQYFAVTAVNDDNLESEYSNEASKVIAP